MIITDQDIREMKDRVVYNSMDMGELGQYIRVEYVMNIIDVLVKRANMDDEFPDFLPLEKVR